MIVTVAIITGILYKKGTFTAIHSYTHNNVMINVVFMYTQCDDKCAFHKDGEFIRLHSRVMLLLPDQHLYCTRMLNSCLHLYLISIKLRWTSAQLTVYSKHNRIKACMFRCLTSGD